MAKRYSIAEARSNLPSIVDQAEAGQEIWWSRCASLSDYGVSAYCSATVTRLDGLGKQAPFVDGQIAAIAYVNELTLVTVNVKDFARFKGVDVVNWSKRRS